MSISNTVIFSSTSEKKPYFVIFNHFIPYEQYLGVFWTENELWWWNIIDKLNE